MISWGLVPGPVYQLFQQEVCERTRNCSFCGLLAFPAAAEPGKNSGYGPKKTIFD